jgi:hypothetical protein
LVIGAYLVLAFKLEYAKLDSLVLAVLTMIAIDELWQTPFNVLNWTSSLFNAEVGLATAGWNLMSLPLLLYFVVKFDGQIKLGRNGKTLFCICLALTAFEVVRFAQGGYPDNSAPTPYLLFEPYYLIGPWFGFFLMLFQSSRDGGGYPPCAKSGNTLPPSDAHRETRPASPSPGRT